jgi:phage head maturation protease
LPEVRSFDAETRSAEVILSTGSEVRRFYGRERLKISEPAVDLGRVRRGQVALLDSHNQSSVLQALGRVSTARVAGGSLLGKITFNETPEGEKAMGMTSRGEISGISLGYVVHDWEVSDDGGNIIDPDKDRVRFDDDLIFTAVKWEIHEASIVLCPADPSARIRSIDGNRSYRDMPVPVSDEIKIRLTALERRAMGGGMSASGPPDFIAATRARMQARRGMLDVRARMRARQRMIERMSRLND